jgi:hypothetical protein
MLPTLFLAWALSLSHLGPYSASSNFSVDLVGVADTRPDTWGTAGVQTWPVTFHPPAGYRVRILSISKGDLIAWPKMLPGDAPIAPGMVAGVLLGLSTTAPEGSTRCTPCADNTMLYIQAVTGAEGVRAPLPPGPIEAGGLLEADNTLIVKVASYLNTTGKALHIEPTFTITYEFVSFPLSIKP